MKKQYQVIAKNCTVGANIASPLTENVEADSVRVDTSGCLLFEDTGAGVTVLVKAYAPNHWATFNMRWKTKNYLAVGISRTI